MKIKIVFLTFLELMVNKSFSLSDGIIVIGFSMLLIGMCSKSGQCIYRDLIQQQFSIWSSSSYHHILPLLTCCLYILKKLIS